MRPLGAAALRADVEARRLDPVLRATLVAARFGGFLLGDGHGRRSVAAGQRGYAPNVAWRRGELILWREVWRGRPWLVLPVRVVEDRPDLLAVYLASGSQLGFPVDSWPWPGEHPWNRGPDTRWRGHGLLTLHRPGGRHAVWVLWYGEKREFRAWYLNLAEPIRRTARGFDTCDNELDVWVQPDGTWELKDEEMLAPWVQRGRWSAEEVAAIRAEGARVIADVDAGRQWWSDEWSTWKPDPSWRGDELPPGWDEPY